MADYHLPVTEARSRFLSLVKEAGAGFARYVITYRGKPAAVMIGFDEFEGWLETLEIARSPSWRRALAQAAREERSGRRLSLDEVVGKKKRKRRGRR